jgi:hypothetical protein
MIAGPRPDAGYAGFDINLHPFFRAEVLSA